MPGVPPTYLGRSVVSRVAACYSYTRTARSYQVVLAVRNGRPETVPRLLTLGGGTFHQKTFVDVLEIGYLVIDIRIRDVSLSASRARPR